MKKLRKFIGSTLLATTLALTSCGTNISYDLDEELIIYTSFSAMTAITKPLITSNAVVIQMTDANVEPHEYEPTAKDVVGVSEADLFIYNGVGFEHYVEKIATSVEDDIVFVNSAKGIEHIIEEGHGVEPHVWLGFDNVLVQATNIINSLIAVDNANEEIYKDNLIAFTNDIEDLQEEYQEVLGHRFGREVVVLHPAYSYIFEPYGISQIAIQPNHDVEPTMVELKNVIDYIKENNVRYILANSAEGSDVLDRVLEETNTDVLVLNSMETLDGDLLETDSYKEIMNQNLESLKKLKNKR